MAKQPYVSENTPAARKPRRRTGSVSIPGLPSGALAGFDPKLFQARLNAILAPERLAIQQQMNRSTQQANGQITNARGFTEALAKILGGIAPQTQQTYTDAANAQSALGRGFSNADISQAASEGGDLASKLAAAGAPQGQIDAAKNAAGGNDFGDLIYGVGGYIPASTMNREGAAYTAEAQQLPAIAAMSGQQTVRQIEQALASNNSQLNDSLAQLAAAMPKTAFDLMDQMNQEAAARQSAARADRAEKVQEEYLLNSLRSTDASITGIDPTTGLPTYSSTNAAANRKAANTRAAKGRAATATKQRRAAEASATKTAMSIISKDANPTTRSTTSRDAFGKPTTSKTRVPHSKDYYTVIHEVEAAITPLLDPYGYKTADIIKFAQKLVNPYYKPGGYGRPGNGRPAKKPKKTTPNYIAPPGTPGSVWP